jgi:hypothetical protein
MEGRLGPAPVGLRPRCLRRIPIARSVVETWADETWTPSAARVAITSRGRTGLVMLWATCRIRSALLVSAEPFAEGCVVDAFDGPDFLAALLLSFATSDREICIPARLRLLTISFAVALGLVATYCSTASVLLPSGAADFFAIIQYHV